MKRFLEMRGADGGSWRWICALPALWVGLLYNRTALDAAWDLVKDWTADERQGLRDTVPKAALATPFRGHTVRDVAREVLAIAQLGLKGRARLNTQGEDETMFLDLVEDVVRSGRTPADDLLARYEGPWRRNIDRVFEECAF
jgi:glutamate--cysteine ligase